MCKFNIITDNNKSNVYQECSEAIANSLLEVIHVTKDMTALEFGIGNSQLSYQLKDRFADIVMIDKSKEIIDASQTRIYREGILNLWPIHVDLEKEYFMGEFSIIYNQMIFHHITNIESILKKLHSLLWPNGYLAIADLYEENGTFHGHGFKGHKGFKVEQLAEILLRLKFSNISFRKCYTIKRPDDFGGYDEYPVFLMVART